MSSTSQASTSFPLDSFSVKLIPYSNEGYSSSQTVTDFIAWLVLLFIAADVAENAAISVKALGLGCLIYCLELVVVIVDTNKEGNSSSVSSASLSSLKYMLTGFMS